MARNLKAKIKVDADTKSAERNLKKLGKTSKSSFAQVEASAGAATGGIGKLTAGYQSLLLKAAAVGAAFAVVVKIFKVVISAAAEQEAAIAKLDAALAPLGASAAGVSEALQQQASALQKVTRFGDEETIQAQALIAAFVKEESQLLELTRVTQDFAEAKGVSLKNAADLITKTFASSTNALTRYGLEVEGVAGSTERLVSLTGALDAAFKGAAEAGAATFQGRVDQLSNSLGDSAEGLGKNVTNSELVNVALVGLRKTTDAYNDAVGKSVGQQLKVNKVFAAGQFAVLAHVAAVAEYLLVLAKLRRASKAAEDAIDPLTGAVSGMIGPLEDAATAAAALAAEQKALADAAKAATEEQERYLDSLRELGLISDVATKSLEDNERTLRDVTRAFDEGRISQDVYLDQYERLQTANLNLADAQRGTARVVLSEEIPAVRLAIEVFDDEVLAVERLIDVDRRRTDGFVDGARRRQQAEAEEQQARISFSERSDFASIGGGTFTITEPTARGANGRVLPTGLGITIGAPVRFA